jgi:hypothetical protein
MIGIKNFAVYGIQMKIAVLDVRTPVGVMLLAVNNEKPTLTVGKGRKRKIKPTIIVRLGIRAVPGSLKACNSVSRGVQPGK